MRVSQTIKNIVAGISQQPPILRHAEQLEEQVNGYSTEADGLQKRPPTVLIKKLSTFALTQDKQPKIHLINRDEQEQYFVSFNGERVQVFDLKGNEYTVKNATHPYIQTNKPLENIHTITQADYTFICNTEKVTRMKPSTKINRYSDGALIVIKQGQYGRTYKIEINGKEFASYTTPDGGSPSHTLQIGTDKITEELVKNYNVNRKSLSRTDSTLPSCIFDTEVVDDSYTAEDESEVDSSYTIPYLYIKNCKSVIAQIKTIKVEEGTNKKYITLPNTIQGLKATNTSDDLYIESPKSSNNNEWRCVLNNIYSTLKVLEEDENCVIYPAMYTQEQAERILKRNSLTILKGENWFYISGVKDASVKASDGFNNQAMKVIVGEVAKVTDLPSTAPDGYIVKIRGEANKDDDYYLRYDAKAHIWKETVTSGIKTTIDASTMPHALVRNSDNTFEIKELEWDKRLSGDEDSNPTPSFIDKKITDIFFFRNRLGFISGENVCLSRSGDYYNFFVDSGTGIVDTDPIDLGVSSTRVSTLHSAVPFNQDLILFSDSAQFILHAEGVLTPKNAYLAQVTAFSNDTSVRPEVSGRNIYFTSKRAEYTSIKEYYAVASDSTIKDASDVTSHVPSYIANTVYDLISNTNENLLLALSTADKTKIYVYKYLYAQDHKLQASWSHWQFTGEVLGLGFINSSLYMLMKYDNLVCLERLDITFHTKDFDKEPYRLMMDRKENITLQGTYDKALRTFTWNAKEHFGIRGNVSFKYFVVLYDGRVFEGTDNTVVFPFVEDLNGQKAFVGIAYNYEVKLSTIYVKHREQEGTQPMDNYRLILQYLKLYYAYTGNLFVLVQSTGKPLRKYHLTGRKVGNVDNKINVHPIITGEWKVPIHGTNTDTTITIINDSPLPSTLIGFTWMGNMTNRFQNV